MLLDSHIQELGFRSPHLVKDRKSVADLFSKSKRCGIYIIEFENKEIYIGKAIDVARRYSQHRKIHNDIKEIRFRPTAKTSLDEIEQGLIHRLERAGFSLRNVVFTSIPKPGSDFESLVALEQQELWLNDALLEDPGTPRSRDAAIDMRSERSFANLKATAPIEDYLPFLRYYIEKLLPFPRTTEIAFWSISALLKNPGRSNSAMYRINIYWQEVMSVCMSGEDSEITLRCARSPLEAAPGGIDRISQRLGVEFDDFGYAPGGSDQISLSGFWNSDPLRILRDEDIAQSIRLFNLRLMNKGPNNFSRSHCSALVTAAYMTQDPDLQESSFWTGFWKG